MDKWKWLRVKNGNKYGYVKVNSKNKPIEFNKNTGQFKVYLLPNDKSHFFETSLKSKEEILKDIDISNNIRLWVDLDEITVTPLGVFFPEDYNANNLFKSALQAERNKEIARNRAIDAKVSQYAFTPEGFFGQALQPTNLLSPTHTTRALWNIANGSGYGDFWKDMFMPNNGLFSDEFAEEHPYWTMAGNFAGDALAVGSWNFLRNMPKYRAAMQAENRAAQEAVANQWDDMISRGTSTQTPYASTTNPGSMVLFERPTSNLSVRERLGLPKGNKVYTEAENQQFLNQINDFASKYGYQGLVEGTYTAEELESYARALIDRHNKFYRGVTMPTNEKDIANIKSILGENATDDEILQYVATHPREGYLVRTPEENGVNWLTPNKEQASIFGDTQNGKTAIVSRHYKLGDDRTKWFDEGDYTMTGGANWHLGMGDLHEPYTDFVTPDGRRFTTSLPAKPRTKAVTEVVNNKPTVFRGWANESNPKLLSGKYPEIPVEYWQKTHPMEITAENAASMTPEQWTAAQDAAIARGDMTEAQRLRDLHFKVNAPYTKIVNEAGDPLRLYHGTKNKFHAFDESLYGNTDGGMYGTGVYTTPYKDYAELYGDNIMELYANISNPVDARNLSIDDLMLGKRVEGNDLFRWVDIGGKKDGVLGKNHYMNTKYPYEVVSHKPTNVKSAAAITYNNNGIRIPLGDRDNFNINDIRYSWLPWLLGTGTLYGVSKR